MYIILLKYNMKNTQKGHVTQVFNLNFLKRLKMYEFQDTGNTRETLIQYLFMMAM